jgi:hypothetical protein
MICYKDNILDPTADQTLKTVRWRDAPLNRPEQVLVGVQTPYDSNGPKSGWETYVVTNSSNWVYAGTGFQDGDRVPGIIGYESDKLNSENPGPPGVTLLSHSPFIDGNNNNNYSNSSIYQASPSGGWVFASGTMAWPWALDDYYPEGRVTTVDVRIQRTMSNVLDRFITP